MHVSINAMLTTCNALKYSLLLCITAIREKCLFRYFTIPYCSISFHSSPYSNILQLLAVSAHFTVHLLLTCSHAMVMDMGLRRLMIFPEGCSTININATII